MMDKIKKLLEQKFKEYNHSGFIKDDPISLPHLFSKKQDIEIVAFFAATLAWGQRVTIIKKCKELIERMDNRPYDFVKNAKDNELKSLLNFKHRTFNDTDLLFFISFFQKHFQKHDSLESLFATNINKSDETVENGLNHFYNAICQDENLPHRTLKHVAAPFKKSACKRLNMYLRWMVRKDKSGVDFGIWNTIRTNQLVCPVDVHVERVARNLKLINRPGVDWITAVELTDNLKKFDSIDPVKYDFALFCLGLEQKM